MKRFQNSKYTDMYVALMESRKERIIIPDEYYESHHIIPKSIGGSDINSNLVLLTYREHIIAHYLLIKIVEGIANKKRMQTAFTAMIFLRNEDNGRNKTIPWLRVIEYAKKCMIKSRTGKKHSEETKRKISQSRIYPSGANHPFYGKTHSTNTKSFLSEKRNRQFFTEETIQKRTQSVKEYWKHNDNPRKGKPRSTAHEIVQCSYCAKEGIKPNMIRWHFDNCKYK